MEPVVIDAKGMHYTPLNQMIRKASAEGVKDLLIQNVMGQRFIGDGLTGDITITVEGVPGGIFDFDVECLPVEAVEDSRMM